MPNPWDPALAFGTERRKLEFHPVMENLCYKKERRDTPSSACILPSEPKACFLFLCFLWGHCPQPIFQMCNWSSLFLSPQLKMYQQLSIGKALYAVFCQHHFVKAVHVTVDGKTLLYGPGKEMDSRPESWPCHMQTMRIGVLGFSVPQIF